MSAVVKQPSLARHPVVTPDRWIAERKKLLAREKELTHLYDRVAEQRRAMPWVRIDKEYVFDTPVGKRTLADLFEGRSQLMVQHFMLGPGWGEGCPSCSYMADHTDGMQVHLEQRDISFVAVSRAPLAEIERFHQRMGWKFRWVSSNGNDFNYDFHVSFTPEEKEKDEVYYNFGLQEFEGEELPGISVFCKNKKGEIFHTYSAYRRGVEVMMGAYFMMDLTPKGRDEEGLSYGMEWVRYHDSYEPMPKDSKAGHDCCGSHD
jgi:predicted dithiol-disulfide oxidoreductase (DUF899 family)